MSLPADQPEHLRWSGSPVRYPSVPGPRLFRLVIRSLALIAVLALLPQQLADHRDGTYWAITLILPVFWVISVGWALVQRSALRRSVYTLTDRRLVADWRVLGTAQHREVLLEHLPAPRVSERADGSGSIIFDADGRFARWSSAASIGSVLELHQIESVRWVHDTIATSRAQRGSFWPGNPDFRRSSGPAALGRLATLGRTR